MGSGQSSPGDADNTNNKGSFSVDPSGKISQPKPKVPPQQQKQASPEGTNSKEAGSTSQDTIASQQQQQESTSPQLATLGNMNRTTNDIGLSLQEADEVLTRMKAKYKPNAAETAGRGRGKLDEIERNLLHCYKTHKNQPLACARLSKEYQEFVRQTRGQFLQGQVRSDTPIAT